MRPDSFKSLTLSEAEMQAGVVSRQDIYVYLASEKKHLIFVASGETISANKAEGLRKMNGQQIFVRDAGTVAAASPGQVPHERLKQLPPESVFNRDVMGEQAQSALKDAYQELLDPNMVNKQGATALISEMSESILSVVAPEIGDARTAVLKNIRYLSLMNHAAAISTLAALTAMALDFRSKTALQNLTLAALLMDVGLSDLGENVIETYYRNRKELPSHQWERIKNHPVKSQQVAASLPLTNDTINTLILQHHELHNGQGYHRGLHTGNSMVLAQILAYAVDTYEVLKGAELRGQNLSFRDVILFQEEAKVPPHQRRHSVKVTLGVKNYLGMGS